MSSNYISYPSKNFFLFTTCFTNGLSSQKILSDLFKKYKIDGSLLADVNQVHSNKILVVDKSGNYGDADGIITSPKDNLVLLIKTADCIPIFIYDNITRNYGIVHAGWRGVKKKIHLKAIEKFIGLGSHKNNLNFVMGPSIKACCYEVGAEMLDYFGTSVIEKNGSFFLDLNKSITSDFVNIGIVKDKIKIDSICTYENKHLHSFRRDREKSGRMLSVIVNKK
ncbi:MAG: hypothetical protein CL870_00010 [Cytophagia bacterium]|nr:hypothetical protein [Cytophagia bacterium]